MTDAVPRALGALAAGDEAVARGLLEHAPDHPRLAEALLAGLADRPDDVYDAPAAFAAFIDGGGNIDLYGALGRALQRRLGEVEAAGGAGRLLDIGTGDGRVVAAALGASNGVWSVDAVEPSAELAAACESVLTDLENDGHISSGRVWCRTIEEFLGPLEASRRWAMAQATFALHGLPPGTRVDVLTRLRRHIDTVVIAEFDVPELEPGSPEHLSHLADRYEAGIGEYHDDRDLVARGFLVPVLLGQIDPDRRRHTWEQPIARWTEQLAEAGYEHIEVTDLHPYWWAPAVLITATGHLRTTTAKAAPR